MSIKLHPENFPLRGSSLIEASAGTGKTWTIAALYLRLILGNGNDETRFSRALMPSDILVMTFTRAATRELSDRIRARLLEAAKCFRNEANPSVDDLYLKNLLGQYPEGVLRQQAAWRLAMAAESMDEASVHTIDAWCQRMLREHAFDTGNLFEEELVVDEQALLLQAVQDYWRQQCYGLKGQALDDVLSIWSSADELLDDIKSLLDKVSDSSQELPSLTDVLTSAQIDLKNQLTELRKPWLTQVTTMRKFVLSQDPPRDHGWDGRSFSIANIKRWLNELEDWAKREDLVVMPNLKTGWTSLSSEGLKKARRSDASPLVMDSDVKEAFEAFWELKLSLEKLPIVSSAARLHAASSVAQRMIQLKRIQGTFGFSDMLFRLDSALKDPTSGARLRERIEQQYPVALIDEFQDTSPIQYSIFDQIYQTEANNTHSALMLIGDPKQSIYGFRGADIYSYLKARQATEGRHFILSTNFRSTEGLVAAVNEFFSQAETNLSNGAFQFKKFNENLLPFEKVDSKGRSEKWINSQGEIPAITFVHDLDLKSMGAVRKLYAERCAEQISVWLKDSSNGFEDKDKKFEQLRPKDIAILVRTGKEAAAVKKSLQKRKVNSVYLSDKDSVYQSDEARDLVYWLFAVSSPQETNLARVAFALKSLGLTIFELNKLATDDEVLDEYVQKLHELRKTWQTQGVLAMLRQSLNRFGLASRWLKQDGGERSLTNYLHLAELLQNASGDLEGEQALVRWLINQISGDVDRTDEQVVRLESDADLVKIVTIHASKGLEYPVVCLPFSTCFKSFRKDHVTFAYLPTAEGERELILDLDEETTKRYEQERMREDLRLLYVAMTRARHALWIGFSAVKVGNGNSCKSHESAMGYLIGGADERDAQSWLEPLQKLAQNIPTVDLQAAVENIDVTRWVQRHRSLELQEAPKYEGDFDRTWTVASYSRLTRDTKIEKMPSQRVESGELSPLEIIRAADDEVQIDSQNLTTQVTDVESRPIWHKFKRGPVAGNFLHKQLDMLSNEAFALKGNDALSNRLRASCERDGHKDEAPALVNWLTYVVSAQLPEVNVALSELATIRSEMEFWLPARQIDTVAIDALCREHLLPGVPRPQLQSSTLHGMLMGFIDLTFEHDGRYWVLDYKSNSLGADDSSYDSLSLAKSMAEHRYDVQAAIYLLALHRLLKRRLGSTYDPSIQLGGAVYLFLRGIHGPAGGTCVMHPSVEFLNALDAMLDPWPEYAV